MEKVPLNIPQTDLNNLIILIYYSPLVDSRSRKTNALLNMFDHQPNLYEI